MLRLVLSVNRERSFYIINKFYKESELSNAFASLLKFEISLLIEAT